MQVWSATNWRSNSKLILDCRHRRQLAEAWLDRIYAVREAEPRVVLPRLYCIVNAGCFAAAPDPTSAVLQHVRELIAGGAMLIQYRNKLGTAREVLSQAREVRRVVGEETVIGHWALAAGEGAVGHGP